MELLTQLNREGKTIIMVTHEPEIADYARRKIVIRDGEITQDTTDSVRIDCQEVGMENWKFALSSIRSHKMRSFFDHVGYYHWCCCCRAHHGSRKRNASECN